MFLCFFFCRSCCRCCCYFCVCSCECSGALHSKREQGMSKPPQTNNLNCEGGPETGPWNCVERSRMPHLECRAKKASKIQNNNNNKQAKQQWQIKKYVTQTAATTTFRKTNGNCEIYKCVPASIGELHGNSTRLWRTTRQDTTKGHVQQNQLI